jgi:hypothetical protein
VAAEAGDDHTTRMESVRNGVLIRVHSVQQDDLPGFLDAIALETDEIDPRRNPQGRRIATVPL